MSEHNYKFDAEFDHSLGQNDAPITIVAYESVTCPHCREFMAEVFPKIQNEYVVTGKVNYILREVYFDQAGILAGAMLRAIPRSNYFSAIERLFSEQLEWLSHETLQEIGNQLINYGMEEDGDEQEIVDDMNDESLAAILVQHSQSHIQEDGVRGTPSLIINGELVSDWSFENISSAIEAQAQMAQA